MARKRYRSGSNGCCADTDGAASYSALAGGSPAVRQAESEAAKLRSARNKEKKRKQREEEKAKNPRQDKRRKAASDATNSQGRAEGEAQDSASASASASVAATGPSNFEDANTPF